MPLNTIFTGDPVTAISVQEIKNLLTGIMTDQPVLFTYATGAPLQLNRTDAAAIKSLLNLQQAGVIKAGVGLDSSNQFAILNAARNAVNFGLTDLGAGTLRAALAIAGALTGVTALTMAGALSGVTTLAMAGALSGATSGGFSGEVTMLDAKVTGISGLNGGRYVGTWATLGPPTGITAVANDFGFDGNGNLWLCTTGGSSGTWAPRGVHMIDTQTPAAVNTINLGGTTLPTGYDWFEIVWQIRQSNAVATDIIQIRFNNDSGANYYDSRTSVNNGAWAAATESLAATSGNMGFVVGSSAAANLSGQGRTRIENPVGTGFKRAWETHGTFNTGVTTGLLQKGIIWGLWNSTAALTRITMLTNAGNFASNSWVKLLGGVT